MNWKALVFAAGAVIFAGCREADVEVLLPAEAEQTRYFTLSDVARLLSAVPLEAEQIGEVHDAAAASAANGYDEEYLMRDVFSSPGAGVGDAGETKAGRQYARPLRELLLQAAMATKADMADARALLDSLAVSDVQIYWPYSELWDGKSQPVITFDPGNPGDSLNVGFLPTGEEVLVDEQMARERPVWVVSNNSDAGFTSLEMLRRQDPTWGHGGGDIVIKPSSAEEKPVKTLVLKSFKSHRQYDSWFAGASEFFVKAGSINNMHFSGENELLDYRPEVTDFMIVIRRNQVGKEVPFNAILASEWAESLASIGLMIIEDDGGKQNTWDIKIGGKYNNKSYEAYLSIPINSRDDIVWRGSLSRGYVNSKADQFGGFGDVELKLDLI